MKTTNSKSLTVSKMHQFLLLLWLSVCGVQAAIAAPVMNLYEASLPIASQSEQERNTVLPQVLLQVLIKVSGDASLKDKSNIQENLEQARSMVQEFSYATVAKEVSASGLLLKVKFNAQAVNNLLRTAKLPIWGNNRPLAILWLVQQVDAEPKIIGAYTHSSVVNLVQYYAQQRGIPIILPTMDLDDLDIISAADITASNFSALKSASTRYSSDSIIAADLTQPTPDGWHSVWTLWTNGEAKSWTITGVTLNEVVATAMDNLAETLSKRYSKNLKSPTNRAHVLLKVSQVNDMAAYSKIMAYLRRLTPVANVRVLSMESNQISFDITLRTERQALIQALDLDKTLVAEPTNDSSALLYRWSP